MPDGGTRFVDDDWSELTNERAAIPEQMLWVSVIRQAVADALCPYDQFDDKRKSVANTTHQGEAVRFLTSDLEPWRTEREEVCALAGVDPDEVRARSLVLLHGSANLNRQLEVITRRAHQFSASQLDTVLGRLARWEQEKRLPPL